MTIIKHIQKLKTKAYTEVENNKKIEEIIRKFESTIKDIDAKSSNLTANHLKKRNEFMSSMNDVAKELATKYDSYELKSIFYYTVEILGNQQFSDFHKKWGEFDAESKLHNIIGTKLEHPMLIIDGYNVKSYLQRFYEDKNKSEISKEARSYFQEFISIGRDDELCNYIYTMASESLGTAKDRKLVDAALTQEMLSSFYKKTIPLSAIRELIEAGTIKKIDIKKTRTFANIGKVKMKEYDVVASSYANNSYFKSDLRDELRDELTKEELFRSFFVCFKNHDHPVSLSASVFNYYCDGQHTISFEEANEIASKSSYFNISSTKAYKSRIDKTFEEDRTRLTKDYQTLSIVNEEFESREGELYVRSVFSSKAFVFHDEIWDEIADIGLTQEKSQVHGLDGERTVEYEFQNNTEYKQVMDEIKSEFHQKIKDVILPGDLVKVTPCEDDEYYEKHRDRKGVVTGLLSDDRIKIKGIDMYFNSDNLEIVKKAKTLTKDVNITPSK